MAEILVAGIGAAPPEFVDSALLRMETFRDSLFWEVNERVVAFDWVDPDLRAQIPALREALRSGAGRPDRRARAAPTAEPEDRVQPLAGG